MGITLEIPTKMVGFTMEGRAALEPKPQPCGYAVNARDVHEAEAIAGATKALGVAPRLRFDDARKVWVATVEATAERAKLSGEWATKLGAIRRLRNAVPARASQDSYAVPVPRPEPGGGSTSMLDTLASRKHVEKPSISSTIKKGLSFAVYGVVALVAVVLAWEGFVKDAVTPARHVAPVTPVVTVAPEPIEEYVSPPVAPAPRRSRRGTITP